ncbi:hypothetical protein [Algoriphagus sp. A40]|uniref:hypothetical protein n=1 Tax=Algoriphagus sp. A40 TaxID=1945863 RepID=UPI001115A625|nr:hypothetical protein [Algoriphagus sp. A40]
MQTEKHLGFFASDDLLSSKKSVYKISEHFKPDIKRLFFRFIYALAFLLLCASSVTGQNISKIVTSRGDTIDMKDPDQQLKYILNNQFAKIIAGNTFAGLGNYAAVSTSDNTLAGSLNIVWENNIVGIKIGGGLTDGVSTLFENNNLNTNVSIGVNWNFLLANPEVSVDYMGIQKIIEQNEGVIKKFHTDSVKALGFENDQILKIEAKQKEIDDLNRVMSIRRNSEWTDFYRRQEALLTYELEGLQIERVKFRTKMDEIIAEILANNSGGNLRHETLKAEAFEFAFDKKIRDKEKEIKAIQEELAVRSDPVRIAFDSTKLAVLNRELQVLNYDLYYFNKDMEIVKLRYERELALRKVGAGFDLITPDDIRFKWITIGGEASQNSYSIYDITRPETERLSDVSDITPSFVVAYSGLLNSPLIGAKRKARHVKFYSFGFKGEAGNNIDALEAAEFTTTDVVNSNQTVVTKKDAFVGEFDKSQLSILFFADYYQFVGTRDNIGFHLRGTVDAGQGFKPVTSLRTGLVFPFTDSESDDHGSFLNLELFIGINDIFDRAESGSFYNRSVAGIQATFPLSFTTL